MNTCFAAQLFLVNSNEAYGLLPKPTIRQNLSRTAEVLKFPSGSYPIPFNPFKKQHFTDADITLVEGVLAGENAAFAQYINNTLWENVRVNRLLPLDVTSDKWFEKLADGSILMELVNLKNRRTVLMKDLEWPAFEKRQQLHNVKTVLKGALKLGLNVSTIDPLSIIACR